MISWRGARLGKLDAVVLEVVSDRTSATTRDSAARSREELFAPLVTRDPVDVRRESPANAFG